MSAKSIHTISSPGILAGLILSLSILPVSTHGGVLTFLWEESGSNVTLTLSGSLDVAGWLTLTNDVTVTAGVIRNYVIPEYPLDLQHTQINRRTTGGNTYYDNGTLDLSPWNTPTGADVSGAYQSGSFRGQLFIDKNADRCSAAIQTSDIVGGVYTVDAVYQFNDTSLNGLFGDGLSAWSAGAQIGTLGSNQIVFAVKAVPEPSATALLVGASALALGFRRRLSRS